MIAVDTSALLAILFGEADGPACQEALVAEPDLIISASTLAEAYVVARGRGVLVHLADLLDAIPMAVIPVDGDTAARVSAIYGRWGKGLHPARLNILDCFSYDVASQHSCPLLFVGNDFRQTDIRPVLG